LILRSEDFKGVDIFTLEDGAQISKIEKMHKKAILAICLLNDMTTLISAGKDKTIKVWNIATYENICSL
jgi:WD40 repeat protein